jgi:hypothetical protein
MSYGQYRNSGIHLLGRYAQALEKFERTIPIRGREVECRPLGHRNRTHFSIDKDKTTGNILCYEQGNYSRETKRASITFRPNGEVYINPNWQSISSAGFIYDVLGVYAKIFDGDVIISLGRGNYRVTQHGVTIKRDEEGKYVAVNYVRQFTHSVKRKETNIVRSKYSEFRDFVSGFIKLRGNALITHDELEEIFGFTIKEDEYGDGKTYKRKIINKPSMVFSKPEDMQNLFNLVASDDPTDRFKAAVMVCSYGHSWRASESLVFETLDKCILAHHKAEVFAVTEVSEGQIVRDRYSWAF